MVGQRLPDGFNCTRDALKGLGLDSIPNGAYWKELDGTWSCMTPNGRLGGLARHAITEHEDGTITVSPSILVFARPGVVYTPEERDNLVLSYGEDEIKIWERGFPEYHGYLEHGVWRSC